MVRARKPVPSNEKKLIKNGYYRCVAASGDSAVIGRATPWQIENAVERKSTGKKLRTQK